eukprot:2732428-Rhodomonas_salina.3
MQANVLRFFRNGAAPAVVLTRSCCASRPVREVLARIQAASTAVLDADKSAHTDALPATPASPPRRSGSQLLRADADSAPTKQASTTNRVNVKAPEHAGLKTRTTALAQGRNRDAVSRDGYSSLLGTEPGPPHAARRGGEAQSSTGPGRAKGRESKGCLLYTSDAADDM